MKSLRLWSLAAVLVASSVLTNCWDDGNKSQVPRIAPNNQAPAATESAIVKPLG